MSELELLDKSFYLGFVVGALVCYLAHALLDDWRFWFRRAGKR